MFVSGKIVALRQADIFRIVGRAWNWNVNTHFFTFFKFSSRKSKVKYWRVMACSSVLIHWVECLHIVIIKFKIKNTDIFGKACRIFRFRNRDNPLLNVPTEQNLRRRFWIFVGNIKNSLVVEIAAQKRCPRHNANWIVTAKRKQIFVVQQRSVLYLINHRLNCAVRQKIFKLADFKIANADAFSLTVGIKFFHSLPSWERSLVILTQPMHQKRIEIIGFQPV